MTTETYTVMASLRDGGGRWVTRHRVTSCESFLTVRKASRIRLGYEDAQEMASRLNGVAAQGHYHKSVSFFYTARVK